MLKDYRLLGLRSMPLILPKGESSMRETALITTIALLLFKENTGSFPDDLGELIKSGYLTELPQDPYSDGPLRYKKTQDNFTLYSLGQNFKDDGGQAFRDSKGRIEMWSDKGDTVFWPVEKDIK